MLGLRKVISTNDYSQETRICGDCYYCTPNFGGKPKILGQNKEVIAGI